MGGLLFSYRRLPIYGGYVYIVAPRLVFGVNSHLQRNVTRNPTEPQGTRRNSKMGELRLESGILGIRGPAFCLPFVATQSTAVSCI